MSAIAANSMVWCVVRIADATGLRVARLVDVSDYGSYVPGKIGKRRVGGLHGGDARVGIHRRQVDCGIGLLPVLVEAVADLGDCRLQRRILWIAGGDLGEAALDPLQLLCELGANSLDFVIVERCDQRQRAVDAGVSEAQLVLQA